MRNYLAYFSIILILFSCNSNDGDTTVKPVSKDIVESVYASVQVRPKVTYFPQALRSGIINEIYVQEGDTVDKGQILFQISPTADIKSQLTNAEINLQEAQSNYLGNNSLLNNIKIDIQALEEQVALDSINYEKQKRLWAQEIGKKSDFDLIKLRFETSQKQLANLKQKLAQTKITLANNYKKALNQTNAEKSVLDYFTVRSEMDGKVYTLNKEIGEFIGTQEKFAEIGSAKDFTLEMDIDEVDVVKIDIGDSVLIILDAYKEQVFVARVDKIFPKKDDLTQTFRVESSFLQAPPKLFNGLAGEANIVVAKRKDALVIPSEYLINNNKVKTTDGIVEVKVGLKNLEFVEILSGIDASTVLEKPEE